MPCKLEQETNLLILGMKNSEALFSHPPVPIDGLEEGLSLSHSSLQYSGQFSEYSGIVHLFVNFWGVMPCKLEQETNLLILGMKNSEALFSQLRTGLAVGLSVLHS
jgi:hypothetical protein